MTKSQLFTHLVKLQEDSDFDITAEWRGNLITIQFYDKEDKDVT